MSEFVDHSYEMDPGKEKILNGGRYLRNGMVVLIADPLMRYRYKGDVSVGPETNRWATVSQIRFIYGDNTVVRFVGVYEDGTQAVHTYGETHAWIVKLDSIPDESPSDRYEMVLGMITEAMNFPSLPMAEETARRIVHLFKNGD